MPPSNAPAPQSSAAKTDKENVTTTTAKANVVYGKGAQMPVMAVDKYAAVDIPELDMFDPLDEENGVKIDSTVVFVGKRRTGKTWLARNLLYLLKDKLPAGICISQTNSMNHFWEQYMPSKYIFDKYRPELLDAVFARQKAILNSNKLTPQQKEKQAPFFIILDDVISDPAFQRNEPQIKELFVAGRHYKLLVLVTTQYSKAITPTLRGNSDFLFIMKTIQQGQREALWEDFADFLTKDAFSHIIDRYTEDNETLVVNTNPHLKVDPCEILKWWKAIGPPELPPFKLGSKQYWESAMNDNEGDAPPTPSSFSPNELLSVHDVMPEWALKAIS